MPNRAFASTALFAALTLSTAPAFADGEILITQAKALAGNVTPGDAAGFPITLSLPGSYQFASNILPTAGVAAIHAAHRNITIDLNGFELHGANEANHGVVGNQVGTTIKNGTITAFKYDGISGTGTHWIVENMRIIANGRTGINLGAQQGNHRVLNNTVSGNANFGITCVACLVQGNVVGSNGSYGVNTAAASVLANLILQNGLGVSMNGGGYGQNTIIYNDSNSANQVNGGDPLNPNYCYTGC